MVKFLIQVTCPAYGSSTAFRALKFTETVLKAGHCVSKIFFYQDGVSHANELICPASDEFNVNKSWQVLARKYDIELICCVSAALRRGVVAEIEAQEEGLTQYNVSEPFVMAGIGELVTGLEKADKVVTF
ncbi:sulfurtransferase complex subunit TusD [Shewanella sp. 202IG2-18]|uniref:sulfurtransferase complex subunit TusD n=1 Tax=Parashewanella hymeniacidonis TaxID=2807618 RepID=UPI001961680C|nr:sulfurtransferase complex subunit TusD [Parashewanella hymeniacidonis]